MGTAEEDGEREREFALRIGTLVQKLRLDRDLSQDDLAESVGVSVASIGRWERGVNPPKAYQLTRIAAALECPADWLLDPPDATSDLDRAIQAAVEQGRLAAYRPRRRATKRNDDGPSSPPSQRRSPTRRGSGRG